MSFALTWLPDVLRNAGLKVALVDGWETRGRGQVGETLGVICHHTVGVANGNMPSLDVLIRGRPDLSGPLSQLGLGRDGTFYVIAAGIANHAGAGSWKGVRAGNTHFIGIEAEHTGNPRDPWPEVQMDAYQRGVAAIIVHAKLKTDDCIGHKEWAPGRKPDPTFDMNAFRARVDAILAGALPPALIPAAEPTGTAGRPPRPTLRRGANGPDVRQLQQFLGLTPDGSFGPRTEAALRAVQRRLGLVPDGIVGPRTWTGLDQLAQPTARAAARTAAPPDNPTSKGEQEMPTSPWPDNLASRMVASYLGMKFGVSPGEILFRNPPMGAMPFFNDSASAQIREAELGLVAGEMLRHFVELRLPFEPGENRDSAHLGLLQAMVTDTAPSAGMSLAINQSFRFRDEA